MQYNEETTVQPSVVQLNEGRDNSAMQLKDNNAACVLQYFAQNARHVSMLYNSLHKEQVPLPGPQQR